MKTNCRPIQHATHLLAAFALLATATAAQAIDGKAVDDIFNEHSQTTGPGCAVGVYRDGRLDFARGYGMASLELGVPITPQTVFYIASTSKQFAAAAVALASLEGQFSLTDSIREYFPELPAYADDIEVQHLVHHTSGLRDYLGLMPMGGYPIENRYSNQWILDMIARQENTNYPPGQQYSYTNSGYFLMGELIRRTTGKSLRQYTDEKIFQPLGMVHTHFHDDRLEIDPGRAVAYKPSADGGYVLDWYPNFDKVGSGGLHTTVEDLLLWERNFLDDRLGGGRLVDTMLQRGRLSDGEEIDYAFGLTLGKYRGLDVVHHGGAFMGFRAHFMRLPERALAVSVLCNFATARPNQYANAVADLYLTDLEETASGTDAAGGDTKGASARQIRQFSGDYRALDTGSHVAVSEKDGGLAIGLMGRDWMLNPTDDSTFEIAGFPVPVFARFDADSDGLEVLMGESTVYMRLRKDELDPASPGGLSDYTGRFHSRELASDYVITVGEDGSLTIQPGSLGADTMTAKPTFADTFEISNYGVVLEFGRDASGDVDGFEINQGRVVGIRFQRAQ